MAKSYITVFQYKGARYTAHITQSDGTLDILVPHTELHTLLPGGKAVYRAADGLELSRPELTPYQDLLIAILASVEEGATRDSNPAASTAGRQTS